MESQNNAILDDVDQAQIVAAGCQGDHVEISGQRVDLVVDLPSLVARTGLELKVLNDRAESAVHYDRVGLVVSRALPVTEWKKETAVVGA